LQHERAHEGYRDIRRRYSRQVAWGDVVKFRQRINQNHFYDRKSFTPAVGATLMAPKLTRSNHRRTAARRGFIAVQLSTLLNRSLSIVVQIESPQQIHNKYMLKNAIITLEAASHWLHGPLPSPTRARYTLGLQTDVSQQHAWSHIVSSFAAASSSSSSCIIIRNGYHDS